MIVTTEKMRWMLLVIALVAICCTPVSASSLFVGVAPASTPVPPLTNTSMISELSVSGDSAQYQQNVTVIEDVGYLKGLAADTLNGTLFVTDIRSGFITTLNATTMASQGSPVQLSGASINYAQWSVYDPVHNCLYIYDSTNRDLVGFKWDSNGRTLIKEGVTIHLSGYCSGLALDPVGGVLYTLQDDSYTGSIHRINTETGIPLDTLSLGANGISDISSLAVDSGNHRLYLTGHNNSSNTTNLFCWDLSTSHLTTGDEISKDDDVRALAVDPTSHHLFLAVKSQNIRNHQYYPMIRIFDGSMHGLNSALACPSDFPGVPSKGNLPDDYYLAFVPDAAPPTPTPTPTSAITAGFYADGHVGQAPYSVRFQDQSTGLPTAWMWDFGDGTFSTEQNPTHIYTQTGTYNVALTVSNDRASDTCTQYQCIILNTVPTANFTANTTSGRIPLTVQFTDQSIGAIPWKWDFGDGTTVTARSRPSRTRFILIRSPGRTR
jgi:PKD repeat protein